MLPPPKSTMTWRAGQRRFLQWFDQQDKPYLILDAPPGSGKSPLGVAVARTSEKEPSAILVGTKALQEQYQTDYELPMAKGRANFPCELTGAPSCEDAPCTYDQMCEHKPRRDRETGGWAPMGCFYYDAKVKAHNAQVSLHNYAYFLMETFGGHSSWFARDHGWLVLDEADTVEAHVRSASTLEMRWRLVAQWEGVPQYPISTVPRVWNEWAGAAQKFAKTQPEGMSDPPTREEVRQRQRVSQLLRSAAVIERTWPHMIVTREEWGYKLQPVMAGQLAMQRLIGFGERVLMMSGTIGDPYVFAHNLGIPADKVAVFRLSSSFPPEIRPVVYWPMAKMGKAKNEVKEVVAALDQVMEAHPNEPGVVHTVSIKRADEVREASHNRSRLIVHGYSRNPLREYIERATAGEPVVLVSPSVGRGTDFADDLARWQAIIKVPYPDLGDPVVKARLALPGGWNDYFDQAARSLIQMSGRIVRSEEDYGVTYLLTSEMAQLFGRAKSSFPAWWLQAVRRVDHLSS